MFVKYHMKAERSGARIIHACGFDSIPHDLGTRFTVEQLPEGVPLTVRGLVQAGGTFSGGTFHSAVTAFSRARQNFDAARERKVAEQTDTGRVVKAERPKPHRDSDLGLWALPFPAIDQQIILRSARALERYGPEFTYGHYLAVKNLPTAVALPAGVAGVFALAQIPPTRKWLLNRVPAGSGPSDDKRASSWFRVHFHGQGGGKRVVCEVSGGDPGYTETSKMLAEAGLCLATDDLPQTAGQVTTAQAMGAALQERIERAGIQFKVLEAA
jgi:short subunit dehydrogenase-like uncharacterized protein